MGRPDPWAPGRGDRSVQSDEDDEDAGDELDVDDEESEPDEAVLDDSLLPFDELVPSDAPDEESALVAALDDFDPPRESLR